MLHPLYTLVFTVIAFLVVSNLIQGLIALTSNFRHRYSLKKNTSINQQTDWGNTQETVHPELLDEIENSTNEQLLVMRSVTVEDVRKKLDALYNVSPGQSSEK